MTLKLDRDFDFKFTGQYQQKRRITIVVQKTPKGSKKTSCISPSLTELINIDDDESKHVWYFVGYMIYYYYN